MIKEIDKSDIAECVNVIRKSFQTVAEECFGHSDEHALVYNAVPHFCWKPSENQLPPTHVAEYCL